MVLYIINYCNIFFLTNQYVYFKSKPINSKICYISCSPINKDHAVVGYQNGTLILLDILTGVIVHRLIGHLDEIQCLCWSPKYEKPLVEEESSKINENGEKEDYVLLVTSSRDKSIKLWEVSNNVCKLYKSFSLPKKSGSYHDSQRARTWISLSWPAHGSLMGNSKFFYSNEKGELFTYDIKKHSSKKFASAHSRTIFDISYPPTDESYIITCSMDRKISMWCIQTSNLIWELTSLGGYVYSLDDSPCDPGMLAIAVGDNTIRIWNTESAIEDPFSLKSDVYKSKLFWKGLSSKITCTRWHPKEVGILAYGTEDGHIGIIDVYSSKNTLFTHYHQSSIYDLQFCPYPSTVNETGEIDSYRLYSAGGDGIIYIFDPTSPTSPPVSLNDLIVERTPDIIEKISEKSSKILNKLPKRSQFHYNSIHNLIAIGNTDGIIEIYSFPSLKLKFCFRDHTKLVNRIRWHSNPSSEWSGWLATASDDGNIQLYNFNGMDIQSDDLLDHQNFFVGTLKGHKKQVSDISWSLNQPHLIASASYDNSIQIWDVTTITPITNIREHELRVFCISWSHITKDVLFSGSEDQTVRLLNINKYKEFTTPPTKPSKKKKRKASSISTEAQETMDIESSSPIKKERPNKKMKISTKFNFETEDIKSAQQGCIDLVDSTLKGTDTENINSNLFRDNKSMERFLDLTSQKFMNEEKYEDYLITEFWRGNVTQVFNTVIKKGLLNDMWISLAPVAGANVWKELSKMYAEQLEAQGDYHKAVLYFLSFHDVHRAIQVYENAYMFPEAISLARSRLDENDEKIKSIYINWANYFVHRMLYEQASKCYIAIGDIKHAIEIILNRNDKESYEIAKKYMELVVDENEKNEIEMIFKKYDESNKDI